MSGLELRNFINNATSAFNYYNQIVIQSIHRVIIIDRELNVHIGLDEKQYRFHPLEIANGENSCYWYAFDGTIILDVGNKNFVLQNGEWKRYDDAYSNDNQTGA